jgi:large subunit ribosomal protein L25
MATPQTIELARTLPPRLLRFFQRYPPPQLFPTITSQIAATPADTPSTPTTLSTPSTPSPAPPADTPAPEPTAHPDDLPFPNPFQPTKNFTTGRWHGPVYGLRKQADLVKLASSHGVVDLLPWTIKKPGEKEARRIERGLGVKGTGEGQRVKGKLWERTLKGRLEMRRQAMLDMPRLIQEWKQVSCMCACERECANPGTERSWSRVEEVAQREGEEIDGLRGWNSGLEHELWICVYLCVWIEERAYCHGVRAGRHLALYHFTESMCATTFRATQQHIHMVHLQSFSIMCKVSNDSVSGGIRVNQPSCDFHTPSNASTS